MPFYSPLRYPGGKRRLASFIMRLLETNQLRDVQYAEPCAGGAALALALLFEGYARTIHINDLSRPVFAFWHSALNDTDALCRRIDETEITMAEWRRQRTVYENRESASLTDLGFATFFLNRTNRAGIVAGGVIGGKQQSGKWTLDARFTKDNLIQRIRQIERYRDRIRIYQQDALDFTDAVIAPLEGNVLTFYDPPYIERGVGLYLNDYTLADHRALAARVQALDQHWVVTYDYMAAVGHRLYEGCSRLAFELSYSAQDRRAGAEVMFLSRGLVLPRPEQGDGMVPMSPRGSQHSIYAKVEVQAARQ